ncbi:MAG: hypothetical protein M3092_00120, partial [Actinomycetia bacterium]|nr:hypothetical protein [Actinomycetes bacterium]
MLSVIATDTAPGWSAEIEIATGMEVEADFRNGSTRIQFNAEIEDGEVRVRIRTRADDGDANDDPSKKPSTSLPSSTSTSMPSTTSITVPSNSGTTVTYQAGDGGSVTVSASSGSLSILAAVPASGWSAEIEQFTGIEVEADFRNGDRRIQFEAELEDGQVKIKVRDRVDGRDDNSGSHDNDDDNSGSHDNDDDDDNSGSHDNDDDDD